MQIPARLSIVILVAMAFSLAPVRFGLNKSGILIVQSSTVFAASGSGRDGDGGDDDDDDDDDDESGGSDDDDDESGGSDDDDDEGGGSDDDDNGDEGDDESGGRDDDDDDDDDDDENGGSGKGGSGNGGSSNNGIAKGDSGTAGEGSSARSGLAGPKSRPVVRKIEVSRSGIEVHYADGSKEEIENGFYERVDPRGRKVEDRRATGADLSRLRAMSQGVSIRSVGRSGANASSIRAVKTAEGTTEVTYSNGWSESISDGRYELRDPYNRRVVTRPATRKDRSRLAGITDSN